MKVKYAGKWYEVCEECFDYGIHWFEIYDEPETDPDHTDWVHNIEDIIYD